MKYKKIMKSFKKKCRIFLKKKKKKAKRPGTDIKIFLKKKKVSVSL